MIEPGSPLAGPFGFKLVCTSGTARVLSDAGIEVETVRKLQEGRPNCSTRWPTARSNSSSNTPSGKRRADRRGANPLCRRCLRRALRHDDSVAWLSWKALEAYVKDPVPRVRALQDWAKTGQLFAAVEP